MRINIIYFLAIYLLKNLSLQKIFIIILFLYQFQSLSMTLTTETYLYKLIQELCTL